jgi:hypothetical protein
VCSSDLAIKLFPILLLPFLFRRSPKQQVLPTLAGLTLVFILGLPFASAGWQSLASWQVYQQHWEFNPLVLPLAQLLLADLARPSLIVVGALVTVIITVKARSFEAAWFGIALCFLVLSPTVHPWYALWLFVPAILTVRLQWALAAGCLLFSYAVLAYFDPRTGAWTEPSWLAFASWLPALLVVLIPMDFSRGDKISSNQRLSGSPKDTQP